MSASQPKTMRANGTIRRARFVKLDVSDNNSVLEADANEKVFGVAQVGGREAPIPSVTASPPEAANAGDNVQVFTAGQECPVEAGESITTGDYLKSNADGEAIVLDETQGLLENVGAIALESGSDGELIKCQVHVFTSTVDKT